MDLWLTASASVAASGNGSDIQRHGALGGLACSPADDLLMRGFAAACAARDHALPTSLAIEVDSDVPVARGLGSSAAAIVAGVALASELFQLELKRDELFTVAAELDGHPDNVGPALAGGAVLCVPGGGAAAGMAPLQIHDSISFVFAVPDFEFRTSVARAALPSALPYPVAVEAAARAAALVAGLERGDPVLLRAGLADVLHVPFRRGHILGYDDVTGAAVAAGAIGATLSGSGSTIVALVFGGSEAVVGAAMSAAWARLDVASEIVISGANVPGLTVAC